MQEGPTWGPDTREARLEEERGRQPAGAQTRRGALGARQEAPGARRGARGARQDDVMVDSLSIKDSL